MRKAAIFCLLIAMAATAWGQVRKTLPGFWGMPWETDPLSATLKIFEKGGHKLEFSNDDGVAFTGPFAGKEAFVWIFFYQNKIYKAWVSFKYKENERYLTYKYLKNQLIEKYGTPSSIVEKFQAPYREGDGLEDFAILTRKAVLNLEWEFEDGNSIVLFTESIMHSVSLEYRNASLIEKQQKEQAEKNAKDF